MSDRMIPLKIEQLFKLTFGELKENGSIFGIPKECFYDPSKMKRLESKRFDQLLETPIGVAAGPHTQLSQNIIAAWLTGCRYIELKTVQTLDELEVSKPCIDMEDEGYNCEWSQELKLEQSFKEYLNAWIMIHVLKRELKMDQSQLGTIFNMSVGYNMKGILKPNVQKFLRRMDDCTEELAHAKSKLATLYPAIDEMAIPTQISNNITLSTMHGCPPDEIEKIGLYLIKEKKIHTTIKLNPTLNGPKELREILNIKLGFKDVTIPDLAFDHDLKYTDAIKIISNLKKESEKNNLHFAIKLTNTLESKNIKGYFDKSNEMAYMSGRPLHALALNLACKLQKEFHGKLDISFSAGADAFNVTNLLKCNIKPITICSDLLKPGGYQRVPQYMENIYKEMKEAAAKDFKCLVSKSEKDFYDKVISNLESYRDQVLMDPRYHKHSFPWKNIKGKRELGHFDCIQAPCTETCPTHQDVPQYIGQLAAGHSKEALEIIRENNPFPNTTGMACDHVCEDRCTRMNYDSTVQIRDLKRYIASKEKKAAPLTPKRKINIKVAIIGGGPSGLSAAFFLAVEGIQVEVFEQKDNIGGMIANALPNFRSQEKYVNLDIDRIKSLGVTIHAGISIDSKEKYNNLKESFDFIYIATGAPLGKKLNIPGEEHPSVIDFLPFLENVKKGKIARLPKEVVVIGGGNSAIDAVRSAQRLSGTENRVKLLYRRTIEQMPASREEIEELLEEKIDVVELAAPLSINKEGEEISTVKCQKMKLTSDNDDGRLRPVPIEGETFEVEAKYVIKAIGQETILDFFEDDIEMIDWKPVSNKKNILLGGDIYHGPSSIIQAIADGKNCAWSILSQLELTPTTEQTPRVKNDIPKLRAKKGIRSYATPLPRAKKREGFELIVQTMESSQALTEAKRCLQCDQICDVCVTVCPNRANLSYIATPYGATIYDLAISKDSYRKSDEYSYEILQSPQVANIGNFCNECGNCTIFCPTSGRPFNDKPKIYLTEDAFQKEQNNAFFFDGALLHYKKDGEEFTLEKLKENRYNAESNCAKFTFDLVPFEISNVECKKDGTVLVKDFLEMKQIMGLVEQHPYLVG